MCVCVDIFLFCLFETMFAQMETEIKLELMFEQVYKNHLPIHGIGMIIASFMNFLEPKLESSNNANNEKM